MAKSVDHFKEFSGKNITIFEEKLRQSVFVKNYRKFNEKENGLNQTKR